jgi:hypothetical protein
MIVDVSIMIPLSRVRIHLGHMVRSVAGSTGSSMNNDLLNLRASALNQNDQHKNKEHAGSNSDNCRSVHRDTPFPCLDPFLSHGAN